MNRREPPLRVGFLIDTLAPGAGTENQLILLLRRLDRSRITPFLCCLWDDPALAALGTGCPVTVLGFHRLWSPAGFRGVLALRAWIRRERLAVLVTFFRDANLVGSLGSRGLRVKVVSNRRNIGRGYWHSRWELWKLRRLNRMAAGFIANSRAVRDYTRDAEGIDADRIDVVANAVDTDRFRPADPEERRRLRREHGLPETGLLAGCVANLRPIKGVDVLVEAWGRVAAAGTEAGLVLLGDGPDRARLQARAEALGIGSRVRFLGTRHDVPELLRAMDLAVLPSRGEGFSNALLEYMASGLPSVATAVGGNPELLDSPGLGRIVPPEDPGALAAAVLEMAASPELRARMGRAARERVREHHAVDVVLARWVEVLERRAGYQSPQLAVAST